ncbi:unnamed protein product, partial [marine sediment metagenome]
SSDETRDGYIDRFWTNVILPEIWVCREHIFTFQDKTISMWVKMLDVAYSGRTKFFDTTYSFQVSLLTDDGEFAAVFGPPADTEPNAFGHTPIIIEQWTHLALTATNDNSGPGGTEAATIRFYVNGRLRAEEPGRDRQSGPFWSKDYHPHLLSTAGFCYLGGYSGGAPEAYIDDFKLYRYPLEQDEIAWLAAKGAAQLYVALDLPQNIVRKVPPGPPFDADNLDIIDFNDYTKLADMWLHRQYWPPVGKYQTPGWWPMP